MFLKAAGVSHDSPRARTCTFEGPNASNTTKIQREDPPPLRAPTFQGLGQKQKKKKGIEDPPPTTPPQRTPHHPTKCGLAKFGQIRLAKCGQLWVGGEGWGPMDPRSRGSKDGGSKGGGSKGGGPKGGFLILVVFEGRDPRMCTFGSRAVV